MTDTLVRLARLMHRLRLRSPATEAEKREWAAIRQEAAAARLAAVDRCECADSGCKDAPWHQDGGVCNRAGEMHLFRQLVRIGMGQTEEPMVFCGSCGSDALDSGAFVVGADLEPDDEALAHAGCDETCPCGAEPEPDIIAAYNADVQAHLAHARERGIYT